MVVFPSTHLQGKRLGKYAVTPSTESVLLAKTDKKHHHVPGYRDLACGCVPHFRFPQPQRIYVWSAPLKCAVQWGFSRHQCPTSQVTLSAGLYILCIDSTLQETVGCC